jgi:cell division protein FtsL
MSWWGFLSGLFVIIWPIAISVVNTRQDDRIQIHDLIRDNEQIRKDMAKLQDDYSKLLGRVEDQMHQRLAVTTEINEKIDDIIGALKRR